MNRKTLLLGLVAGILAISIPSYAVVVDGYCYLENQSNHAGSRVLFQADSPTAVTDSAFTDATGHYQGNLQPGVYDVFMSHYGYSNAQFPNQLISTPMTFPEVTLFDVPDGIYISGELSGTLVDTIYIVEGDIQVNGNSSLAIAPGARFYFLEGDSTLYGFTVYGSLWAAGTETDTIKFMPAPGVSGWKGLWAAGEGKHLEYCLITGGAYWGLRCTNCDYPEETIISHCTITGNSPDVGSALIISNGAADVSYCTVSGNVGNGVEFINLGYLAETYITHCTVSGNTEVGIYCRETYDNLNIDFCVITGNGYCGIYSNGQYGSEAPCITNCTISANSFDGIYLSESQAIIVNTIVEGNGNAGIDFGESPDASLTYSDIYNNFSGPFGGTPPNFLGIIITTNPNGDSCDAYYNIFVDPQFVDPGHGNYFLQAASLCIDAGDPSTPPDPNGTPPDIGAFYYIPTGVEGQPTNPLTPSEYCLMPNYPNPFNPYTTISFALPTEAPVTLVVYDILGRQVTILAEGRMGAGVHKVNFDGSGLPSGIFFYRLQAGDFTAVNKMVLLK